MAVYDFERAHGSERVKGPAPFIASVNTPREIMPLNVLIVDDDRSVQRLIADALRREGHSVSVERDAPWALETLQSRTFDLLVLSTVLPSMGGVELLGQVRALPGLAHTPALLLTRGPDGSEEQAALQRQHRDVALLAVPFRTSELLRRVHALFGLGAPPSGSHASAAGPPESHAEEDRLADRNAEEEARAVEQTVRASTGLPVLQGNLAERPFPEILAEVYRWRASGAILLKRDRVKKIVYFREGLPQSIKSNLMSECLGRVMVRERMISEAQCEESLVRMKASGRQQGTVLIEMSCISPHNLVYALKLQLQKKLYDIFGWPDGEYQFNAKVELPAEPVQLGASTASIIYEGVRRRYDEARLRALLGDDVESLFVFPAEEPLYALQDAGLGEEEQQFLAAADGHKTVSTLMALELLGPLETLKFVYAMKCAQMIDLRRSRADGRPRASLVKLATEGGRPPPLPEHKRSPTLPPALPSASAPVPQQVAHRAPLAPPPLASSRPRPREIAEPRAGGSLLPELAPVPAEGDEQQLREKLVRQASEMRRMDHYQVLGMSHTASREELKRAYFALAKEYHPDKHFASASAEVRQLATQIYEQLSQAHDVLTDAEKRARYDHERAQGASRTPRNDAVGQILAAEGKFQKGVELLRQNNFRAAYQTFGEAITLYDQEGEFHAYLAWSLFQSEPQNPAVVDAALRSLERAVALNPSSDKTYLFTGYVHKHTGRPDKAEKQFEKAIQCNPDCTEALRELRLLGKARR